MACISDDESSLEEMHVIDSDVVVKTVTHLLTLNRELIAPKKTVFIPMHHGPLPAKAVTELAELILKRRLAPAKK
jgi:hypothetical protein